MNATKALEAAKLKVKNETEISVGSQVREDDLLVKRTFGFLLSRWGIKKKVPQDRENKVVYKHCGDRERLS